MSSPSRRRFRDLFTLWTAAILLIGVVGAGWFARSCPLLRQWLSSCPTTAVGHLTPSEEENARFPHQVIEKDVVEFSTSAQDYRKTTEVKFYYKGDRSHQIAHLAVWADNHLEELALITHPLLANLQWSRYSRTQPNETLYQDTERYTSTDDIRSHLPAAQELAVDEIIAQQWHLTAQQYQPLETLTSLNGIHYVVTTYAPPTPNGSWNYYDQTFDTTDAHIDEKNQLNWMILLPDVKNGAEPFRMTTVHIDYQSLR
jgi:hypothetical protein